MLSNWFCLYSIYACSRANHARYSSAKWKTPIIFSIIHQYISLARDWSKRVTLLNMPQLKVETVSEWYSTILILRKHLKELTWKCHYEKNHIFSFEAIFKHKQIACMLFTIFKYLFFVPEVFKFLKYAISQVMTSYTQPNFDQIWWKRISQAICFRNVWFFAVRFY